jgi:hypothetical protein
MSKAQALVSSDDERTCLENDEEERGVFGQRKRKVKCWVIIFYYYQQISSYESKNSTKPQKVKIRFYPKLLIGGV